MKFVLAGYGTRGEIEPLVVVGRELLHRRHDVHMAVPPDLIGFAEAAGPTAVAYGSDLQDVLDAHRNFWTHFFRNFWKLRELIRLRREVVEPILQCWKDIIATLPSLVEGADLRVTRRSRGSGRCARLPNTASSVNRNGHDRGGVARSSRSLRLSAGRRLMVAFRPGTTTEDPRC
jgi:hypothetical protein